MISSFPDDDNIDDDPDDARNDDNDDGTQPPSPIYQVFVGCGTPQLASAFCDVTSNKKSTLPDVPCMGSAKEPDCPSTRVSCCRSWDEGRRCGTKGRAVEVTKE